MSISKELKRRRNLQEEERESERAGGKGEEDSARATPGPTPRSTSTASKTTPWSTMSKSRLAGRTPRKVTHVTPVMVACTNVNMQNYMYECMRACYICMYAKNRGAVIAD